MDPAIVAQIIGSAVSLGTIVAVVTWQFGKLSERIARLEQSLHDTRGRGMQHLQDQIDQAAERVDLISRSVTDLRIKVEGGRG